VHARQHNLPLAQLSSAYIHVKNDSRAMHLDILEHPMIFNKYCHANDNIVDTIGNGLI
jgi:hypothetical protein